MPVKLHHLRDLLAIVDHGSINAAARNLGIGQPALSRSIRELEKDLGTPLLERHTRGALLTPLGELFARRAALAMGELRRGKDEIHQALGGMQGTVVTCLSSLAHLALLPDALRPFNVRFPKVQLHIIEGIYSMVEAQIKNGLIDLYVGPSPPEGVTPELHIEKLFDNTGTVFCRRGHPLENARSLAELGDVLWVTTRHITHDESQYHEMFAQAGLPPPQLTVRAETALTWITAIAYSDMMSISPRQWVSSPIVSHWLTPVPIQGVIAAPPIVLIRRAAIPLTPAAEFFCDLLQRAAEALVKAG